MNKFATLLATWFGCGYSPVGPGTAGTLGALAIAYAAESRWHFEPYWFLLWVLLLLVPAIWSADVVARVKQLKDPQIVVIDEVAGVWLTLAGARTLNWKTWLAAFFLFRLFDIWKPFPVRQFERLPGGIGIVADDLMAGVYGALVLFAAGCFNLN